MTETVRITNQQARRFLLLKHGLIGPYRFYGKQGILDFVGQAGCIQFDPVDTCGKNAELVLQSRVKDFRKDQLYDLLYTDRDLFDYFDKNLAILRTEDWPHCCRIRVSYREGCRSHREVDAVRATIIERIRKQGPVCSADLEFDTKVAWFWQDTRLSRAALETLYFRGDLVVHHKEGTIKYYDLAERCLAPELLDAPDPFADDAAYAAWRVLRRIGSVGLLWNRASDAWLGEGR
ncbi:MAG: crosslink repair DNA glycosylase YcaQ family protein, partial [Eubacteriales bacterium]|nr:crosslink repair DNA glycosylase YcaQ family protein [Eubacteriales bacterium]